MKKSKIIGFMVFQTLLFLTLQSAFAADSIGTITYRIGDNFKIATMALMASIIVFFALAYLLRWKKNGR